MATAIQFQNSGLINALNGGSHDRALAPFETQWKAGLTNPIACELRLAATESIDLRNKCCRFLAFF